MSLVNSKEIAKVVKLDKFGWLGTFFGWALLKTLRISKLNRIYERHKHMEDIDFLDGILKDFKID
ncbi:MAG: glycerol acyltransferase, partial [Flavobacteriaceae bacterium]